tara:strand:+ start:567 stop:683 length:117 start_codon:yes stop_codon:yes gene_type:complete
MQAFWLGIGQGNGVQASDMANVRGAEETIRKAISNKGF